MKMISVLLLTLLLSACGGYSSPSMAAPQAGIFPAIAAIHF
jgi:hypothetical protein